LDVVVGGTNGELASSMVVLWWLGCIKGAGYAERAERGRLVDIAIRERIPCPVG